MNIQPFIMSNHLLVQVKTNANKTEVLDYDREHNVLKIAVKALPDSGKANKELLRFLKKETKRSCSIRSGATSKKKLIFFE